MNGTKRLAFSNPNSDSNDSPNKRIMIGSVLDARGAEPSLQQSSEPPKLDMGRAELSRKHVRALNTQFASWIQSQLQNHPDELWEDGVQDYLFHASKIMEKFSDVVNWLKANTSEALSLPVIDSNSAQKNASPESKENMVKSVSEKAIFSPLGTSAGFTPSWSSGGFFNNQIPFSFGSQNAVPLTNSIASDANGGRQSAVPLTNSTTNDADGEDELEQPSSPSVKKTEEKGITVVHEVKCKLYVKSKDPTDNGEWKDMGAGQLSIKCKEGISKGTRESKPTIVVRNDVGKVSLNALLYPGIKTNIYKNSIVAIFHTSVGENSDDVVAQTYLIRTKNEDDRNKLNAVIEEYAPAP